MSMDLTVSIASFLGLFGFILSIVNWVRLRPVVFVTGPHKTHSFENSEYTFELHNAGASGVTISAVQIVRPGERAMRQSTRRYVKRGWLNNSAGQELEVPLRLEPYDTRVVILDVDRFFQKGPGAFRGEGDWEFRVEWYGRASWLRLFRAKDADGTRAIRLLTESERRLRSVSVLVDFG